MGSRQTVTSQLMKMQTWVAWLLERLDEIVELYLALRLCAQDEGTRGNKYE